jgi:hypothetical protein
MNKWLKKSILLVGLALITAGPALADGDEETSGGEFSFGTDVVSRYIWRGLDFGDGLSLQPYIAYTHGPIEIGAWSSWGVTSNRANENDLYVTYSTGPVSITVTDYFFPAFGANDAFLDYSDKGGHTIEVSASVAQGPISLLGAINVLEFKDELAKTQNTLYIEGGFDMGEINEVGVSLVAGVGNEDLTRDVGLDPLTGNAIITDGDLNLINANYWASYLINLDRETSYLVFGWTFF